MTDSEDDPVITVGDLRPLHCVWGLRHWWSLHNLDFADFLKNGVRASVLLATGDDLARNAVQRVTGVSLG